MNSKIKIILADDHSMIREGLRGALEREVDMEVVSEACEGVEALEAIKGLKADIILLDVNMPILDGFDVLKHIRDHNYDVKVILFTMHQDVEVLIKAMEIGIRGYVLKTSSSKSIVKAIRTIYNGEIFIEPSMVKYLFEDYKPVKEKTVERERMINENIYELTMRELEVLKLIVKGLLNKEIAGSLYISEKTVKNHVSSILRKMKVYDRTQAAVCALQNKIIRV